MNTQERQDKLKQAWAKFGARVANIRLRTKTLLGKADEQKRNTEMEELRKRIGQS